MSAPELDRGWSKRNNSRTQLASDLWFSPIDRELRGTYALRKIKISPSLEGSVFRQPFKY